MAAHTRLVEGARCCVIGGCMAGRVGRVHARVGYLMPRALTTYRTNQQSEYDITGSPVVLALQSFSEGETLQRARLNLQLCNFWPNGSSAATMAPFAFLQTVCALCWSHDGGGGAPPAGYFAVDADWVWVEQISWYNWPYMPLTPDDSSYIIGYQNTTSSEHIDTKAQRLVPPGEGATLYAVFDTFVINESFSPGFFYYIQLHSFVVTMLPA